MAAGKSATGGLSDLAKESVTNVSAVIKKLTGKDISDYDIHIQFVDTHGVDGDFRLHHHATPSSPLWKTSPSGKTSP